MAIYTNMDRNSKRLQEESDRLHLEYVEHALEILIVKATRIQR